MTFDVASIREDFPSLRSGIAHFDGPGGTQTPRVVGETIAATLTGPLSNRGTAIEPERNAERAIAEFRAAIADLLAADPSGVVYGRSATQITYDFSRTLAKGWGPGDEVVVTRLDHDSNVRPWIQAADAAGAILKWIDIDPTTAELDMASAEAAIGPRTKVVALTAASNLLGTQPDVRAVADLAHAHGALAYVDGVHYTAHELVDVGALGADFFVCSPYKFLGPHCAALAASPQLLEGLTPDKLLPSTNVVPERFEFGTLPYELMAGVAAAVDYLAGMDAAATGTRRERLFQSQHAVDEHETRLRNRIETGLAGFGANAVLHSRAARRTPTLLVTLPGRSTGEASAFLAERGIHAPAGSFYAYEPFARLGLEDDKGLRIGLAPYNDDEDIDRLLTGLSDFLAS